MRGGGRPCARLGSGGAQEPDRQAPRAQSDSSVSAEPEAVPDAEWLFSVPQKRVPTWRGPPEDHLPNTPQQTTGTATFCGLTEVGESPKAAHRASLRPSARCGIHLLRLRRGRASCVSPSPRLPGDRAGGLLPTSCGVDAVSLGNVENLPKRGHLDSVGMKTQRKGDDQALPCVTTVQFERIFK